MRKYPCEKQDTLLKCKFNKFFCSLQQVECFLNTLCRVKRTKKVLNFLKH